jgi:hypothetical protein
MINAFKYLMGYYELEGYRFHVSIKYIYKKETSVKMRKTYMATCSFSPFDVLNGSPMSS